MNFKDFIRTDRESRSGDKFEGTFLDYLQILQENPDVAKLAHKRVYDTIMDKGVETLKGEDNPRIRKIYGRYRFFAGVSVLEWTGNRAFGCLWGLHGTFR